MKIDLNDRTNRFVWQEDDFVILPLRSRFARIDKRKKKKRIKTSRSVRVKQGLDDVSYGHLDYYGFGGGPQIPAGDVTKAHDVSHELRNPHTGEWVRNPLTALKSILGLVEDSRKKRDAARAKRFKNMNPRGTKAGYVKSKNSSVQVDPMKATKLPKTASKQDKKRVDGWAKQNLKPGDAAYATVITRLASKHTGGETQAPNYRVAQAHKNLIAIDPSLAEPRNEKKLKAKAVLEVARLLSVENQVNAQLFPQDSKAHVEPKAVRIKLAGKTSNMTEVQSKKIASISTTKGQRLVPDDTTQPTLFEPHLGNPAPTSHQYKFPDRLVKANVGEHKGKYVRVNANGEVSLVPQENVVKLRAEGISFWTSYDAHAKKNREIRLAKPLPEDTQPELIRTSRDARRARAKWLAAQSGLNPDDTFDQANITGDKTLLTQQDQDWRLKNVPTAVKAEHKALKDRMKELSVPNTEDYINRNKTEHFDPRTDEQIRESFKQQRKENFTERKALIAKYPELANGSQKDKPFHPSVNPLDPAVQAEVDRVFAEADRQILAADQKPTVYLDRRGNVRPSTVKEIAADQKRYDAASIVSAAESQRRANDPNSITTSRGVITSRGRRSGGKRVTAPKREAKEFTSQQGTPLAPGKVPGKMVVPKYPDPITQPVRPATQAELEAMFKGSPARAEHTTKSGRVIPAKAAVPPGTPPKGRSNIQVPVNKNTPAEWGQFSYKYDHQYVKDKAKIDYGVSQHTQAHHWAASERKYARVAIIAEHMPTLDTALKRDAKSNDTAGAVAIMRILAMRPSSDNAETTLPLRDKNGVVMKDSAGDVIYGPPVMTFGATTMQRQHVTFEDNGKTAVISLTGKAAHEISIKTNDSTVVEVLKARMNKKGKPTDRVFSTTAAETIAYIKSYLPGAQNKDLRTYNANEIAKQVIATHPIPTSVGEFINAIKDVSETTANQLQHKPTQSISSYINPEQFRGWAVSAGVDFETFLHPPSGTTRPVKPI